MSHMFNLRFTLIAVLFVTSVIFSVYCYLSFRKMGADRRVTLQQRHNLVAREVCKFGNSCLI